MTTELLQYRFEFFQQAIPDLHFKPQGDTSAICPFHDDGSESLSISLEKGTFNCHAGGCGEHGGLIDFHQKLFPKSSRAESKKAVFSLLNESAEGQTVCDYIYRDAAGEELYRKRRTDVNGQKRILFYHPQGGALIAGKGKADSTLYRLPEVLAAETVFIVEGEKCADVLFEAFSEYPTEWGTIACTTAGSAKDWKKEFGELLRGKRIVVLPDKDAPGLDYAKKVIASALDIEAEARLVCLPDLEEGEDVVEFLERNGAMRLIEEIQNARLVSSLDLQTVEESEDEDDDEEREEDVNHYPEDLPTSAMPGVLGRFVEEAFRFGATDKAGTAIQLITMLGSVLEKRHCVRYVGKQFPGMYTLILGESQSGKGAALSAVRELHADIVNNAMESESFSINSGEALVVRLSKAPRTLWWVPELGQLLNSGAREGSTLLDHGRNAWDGTPLERNVVSTKDSARAVDYSLSLCAHVTPGELGLCVKDRDLLSGWWNRFTWSATQLVPRGQEMPGGSPDYKHIASSLRRLLELPAQKEEVSLSQNGLDAYKEFGKRWDELTLKDGDFLRGATARSNAKLLRIALVLAFFDEQRLEFDYDLKIESRHIDAASEYILRGHQTVRWFLKHGKIKSEGESRRADILRVQSAVNNAGGNLSNADFKKHFSNWSSEKRLQIATLGNVRKVADPKKPEGGRPSFHWRFR